MVGVRARAMQINPPTLSPTDVLPGMPHMLEYRVSSFVVSISGERIYNYEAQYAKRIGIWHIVAASSGERISKSPKGVPEGVPQGGGPPCTMGLSSARNTKPINTIG